MLRRIPDNFFVGVLIGVVTLGAAYLGVRAVRLMMINHFGNEYLLAPPKVQLYSIVINVIIFRFVMVKFDREDTGKGILFSTVMLALLYFYLYIRYNFQMGN